MIAQLLNLSRKFPKPPKKKKKKKVNSITLKIQRYYSYRCIKKPTSSYAVISRLRHNQFMNEKTAIHERTNEI